MLVKVMVGLFGRNSNFEEWSLGKRHLVAGGALDAARLCMETLHPTPYTPTPYTLHPTPYTLLTAARLCMETD